MESEMVTRAEHRWSGRLRMLGAVLALLGVGAFLDHAAVGVAFGAGGLVSYLVGRRWMHTS
jgi:hypothetical protein